MTLRELIIKLGADTTDYDRKMVKSTKQLQDFGSQAESVGMRLSAAISLPIAAVGGAALVAAGKMEQTQVAFTTLLKSADAAKSHIEEMKKFTLVTPFQFEDVTKMSRLMQAMGTDVKNVIPNLRIMGNAVSALGGGGDVLERVVRSMSEIGTRGKITGEQLRELSRAGIPALDAIAAKLGVTVAEAQKQVTAGMVDAKTATEALLGYMEKRFAGGMEAQSKTLLGAWSNIKDKLLFTLAEIGNALMPAAKSFVDDMLDPLLSKLKDLAAGFSKLPKPMQEAALGMSAFAVAAPLAVLAAGMFVTNLAAIVGAASKLVLLLNPVVLGIAAVGIAAGIAALEFRKMSTASDAMQTKYSTFISKMAAETANFAEARNILDKSLANNAITTAEYSQALMVLDDRENKAFGESFRMSGQNIHIMGAETKKLAETTEEAAVKLKTFHAHSTDLLAVTKESAIQGEIYNRYLAHQAELIKDIVDERMLPAVVKFFRMFIADAPAVGDALGAMQGELDKTHDIIEKLNKELNKDALKQLEAQAVEEKKLVRDRYDLSRQTEAMAHHTFDALERGLARNIIEWKGWGKTIKDVAKTSAESMLSIMLKGFLKPLEDQFAKVAVKIGDWLDGLWGGGKAGGGVLGTSVGAAGGAAGTIGGGATSAAGGAAGAAGTGIMGTIGAVSAAVGAVSSIIGNFQQYGMNKSLDVLVNHTLRIFNVVFQMQAEEWQRHDGLIAKSDMMFTRLGDIWTTLRNQKTNAPATYNFDFRGANLGGASQASIEQTMRAAFAQALAAQGG